MSQSPEEVLEEEEEEEGPARSCKRSSRPFSDHEDFSYVFTSAFEVFSGGRKVEPARQVLASKL